MPRVGGKRKNPKIKNFFEEEYKEQRARIISNLDQSDEYYRYLQQDFDSEGYLRVTQGYFSGDKGSLDEKIKEGVDEILKDKKKLLSLESPTRFIFSIWALQEGWDNPNVFTICKLSNQGSEMSKLQQIGRGLRICVNQQLERTTLKKLNDNQEAFWKINNLVFSLHFLHTVSNGSLNTRLAISKDNFSWLALLYSFFAVSHTKALR